MVKLTAEVIQNSHQYTNPVTERELDLRGEFHRQPSHVEVHRTVLMHLLETSSQFLKINVWEKVVATFIIIIIHLNYFYLSRLQNSCYWKSWCCSGKHIIVFLVSHLNTSVHRRISLIPLISLIMIFASLMVSPSWEDWNHCCSITTE